MPTCIQIWGCQFCGEKFEREKDAVACEAVHKDQDNRERRVGLLTKYFPLKHKLDNSYEKHCVDCGKVLLQWEHENHLGAIKTCENHREIMYGKRCDPCAERLIDKILEALEYASHNSSN